MQVTQLDAAQPKTPNTTESYIYAINATPRQWERRLFSDMFFPRLYLFILYACALGQHNSGPRNAKHAGTQRKTKLYAFVVCCADRDATQRNVATL
jgi:hypothetical protein